MNIHEFGDRGKRTIVLIHPSMVMWDYFAYVWPLLEKDYHVVVPALPGHDDRNNSVYTSVEAIAIELENWLIEHGCKDVACMYGCSMGGSIVTKILANNRVELKSAIIDGGITPYKLPWIITRMIAVKDFCLVSMGKVGGIKLLEKAFAMDEYSREDLEYVADIFKWMKFRTIWRTFDSCNNYSMPANVKANCTEIHYWYGDAEAKERRKDLKFFESNFPEVKFEKLDGIGHGGMASLHPELFAEKLREIIG